jgi:hypothetical protein
VVSGWTKNTQKPNLKKGKNHPIAKTQKRLEICQNLRYALHPGALIHQEVWFPPCFVRQNQQKQTFFGGNFRPLPNKNVPI